MNSLHDQQSNITQKIKLLENQSETNFVSSQAILKTCQADIDSIQQNDVLLEEKVILLESKLEALSEINFPHDMNTLADLSNNHVKNNMGSVDNQRTQEPDQEHPQYKAEIVVLMDSNRKFINATKLSPTQKATILKCGNLETAQSILTNPHFYEPKAIVIHVGVNDVESKSVEDICSDLCKTATIARNHFPSSHILFSQITPRSDELNAAISEINHFFINEFQQKFPSESNVSVIEHDNINAEDCLHDRKHLSKNVGVRRLAGNIKSALRQVLGVPKPPHSPRENRFIPRRSLNNQENHNHNGIMSHDQDLDQEHYRPTVQENPPSNSDQLIKQLIGQLQTMSSAMANFTPHPNPVARPALSIPPWPQPMQQAYHVARVQNARPHPPPVLPNTMYPIHSY